MEWFPALRKRLAARGVHLPDPYPYTARTFKGSVLATLLAAILFLIAYAVWEAANYTARNVQRTAFMTIETTAATSRLATEKAGQAVEALFPKPAPVTEASLESILPPGSHLGNQMKDDEFPFDHKSHVLYSKPCKKEILAKIALHYPEAERETVWEKVQRQYAVFLSDCAPIWAAKRTSTTA